jgi:predicted nucleotidyltransferase
MAIFNVTDRKNIMDYIVSFTEQNEHIKALIAVGSGSFGYIDELSDLDMVVAIDKDENMETVMDFVASQLNKRLNFIYFKQMPQRRLQVYISDNYLEIDIGYGAYTSAAATRKNWKVLFDKTGTIDETMRSSWEKHEKKSNTDEHNKKLIECSDVVWHFIMHASVAIKRKQYWRAAAELEHARNLYIELLGCRYSLDTKRGRDVDKLPEAELIILKKTLVSSFSQDDLWLNLITLNDAVYTELKRYGERACITVNRQQVNEYINACRNL